MRILCIDDDITFLAVYRAVLEKCILPGDDLILSPDAESSIAILHDKPVDLVVTDLVMPKNSGIDILKEAKQINDRTEVIVVTGQGSIDTAVEAMRLGARDYLIKPINHGMLIEKISNIREFIGRIKEVEDYRFAKETVETNAHTEIAELEIRLNALEEFVEKITMLCQTEDAGTEHDTLAAIRAYVNDYQKAE